MTSLVILMLLIALVPRPATGQARNKADEPPPASCHVTLPNGNRPPRSLAAAGDDFYGNGKLWVAMWWQHGVIRAGMDAGVPQPGGVSIKTPWVQGPDANGELQIFGSRLDRPAPAINQEEGRGQGFHPTGIVYPTPGCWQISSQAGSTALTNTVWVTFTPELARWISPTRTCPVTTGADGDPGLPQYVIPRTRAEATARRHRSSIRAPMPSTARTASGSGSGPPASSASMPGRVPSCRTAARA